MRNISNFIAISFDQCETGVMNVCTVIETEKCLVDRNCWGGTGEEEMTCCKVMYTSTIRMGAMILVERVGKIGFD
jgi:hypothetical protein